MFFGNGGILKMLLEHDVQISKKNPPQFVISSQFSRQKMITSQEALRIVFECAPVACYLFDDQGTIVRCQPSRLGAHRRRLHEQGNRPKTESLSEHRPCPPAELDAEASHPQAGRPDPLHYQGRHLQAVSPGVGSNL